MKRTRYFVTAFSICLFASGPIAHAQHVKADIGAVAIGGNVISSQISIGIPPEQLAALVRLTTDLSESQKRQIATLEDQLDLNRRQIRAALKILGERDVPLERLAAKLVEIAERFKDLQTSASARPGDDSKVAALKTDAQTAIDAGELAKADDLLAAVEVEQRRDLDRLAVNAAETSARRGQIALTRLRYSEAAKHFADAAAVFPPVSAYESERIEYLKREARALFLQGYYLGDNGALLAATERYTRLLGLMPRERVPLGWAAMQTHLGHALRRLGEREKGKVRFEEAVACFRAALQERTRALVPLDWAETQIELGMALQRIGERETGTARLEEAVAAYRAALQEQDRERVPLAWAATQNLLGLGLWRLAERETGTVRLEEAVNAYRAALQEQTRQRVPLDWAMTQRNLGSALLALGARENSKVRLEEAAVAYRAALQEHTRERVPLLWAMTQNGLGNVLLQIGWREGDTLHLEEAIAAYRAALQENTRQRSASDWAMIQTNLGNALRLLGGRNLDAVRLEQAVAAFREALKEASYEGAPLQWARAIGNQGVTLRLLAGQRGDLIMAEQAVAQISAAVETYREAHDGQAAFYEAQLPAARGLVERLRKR
jgi:tetratricopeptide (TPR) repeat protein